MRVLRQEVTFLLRTVLVMDLLASDDAFRAGLFCPAGRALTALADFAQRHGLDDLPVQNALHRARSRAVTAQRESAGDARRALRYMLRQLLENETWRSAALPKVFRACEVTGEDGAPTLAVAA